jgi:hypothetical protein|tara:strand:- start:1922 stop:3670 length:1749 start_codon:yes stop_codon:yes gene_type:complete
MGSIFGGGGGGGGGGSSSGTQVQIAREAPEVESRKLALYDEAAALAKQPVSIPQFQVAGPTALEQAGFQQAATTGVGQPTTTAGIGAVLGAQQAAGQQLNIGKFMNPYQRFVTDEITRQAQIAQNQLASQAVQAGAFGGGREGVAQAEIERARQANIGQALQQGFGQALGAAERERALQAQTGLQAGQQLGALGSTQQAMQQGDIQSLLQAGGVQRALGQQALDAQRQTSLSQAYEPYQRIEFLKGIMTNLPTSQSSITATTAPGSNPLAQAAGAGLGAYAAYNIARKKEGGMIDKKELKVKPKGIKGFFLGGLNESGKEKAPATSRDRQLAFMAVPLAASLLGAKPGRRGFAEALGEGLKGSAGVGLKIAELESKKGKASTLLTDAELKAAKLPAGTVAQKDSTGKITVVSKPDSAAVKAQKENVKNLKLLNRIEKDYYKLKKPVGPMGLFQPDRIAGFTGELVGTKFGKDYAGFKANIGALTSFFNKAISGATITEQEVERLRKITPQLSDTEAQFEGKTKAMKAYLNDAIKIQQSQGFADLSEAMTYMDENNISISQYTGDIGEGDKVFKIEGGEVIEK